MRAVNLRVSLLLICSISKLRFFPSEPPVVFTAPEFIILTREADMSILHIASFGASRERVSCSRPRLRSNGLDSRSKMEGRRGSGVPIFRRICSWEDMRIIVAIPVRNHVWICHVQSSSLFNVPVAKRKVYFSSVTEVIQPQFLFQ